MGMGTERALDGMVGGSSWCSNGPGPIGQPKEASIGIFAKFFECWGDIGEVMKGHQSTYQPFESIPLLHASR